MRFIFGVYDMDGVSGSSSIILLRVAMHVPESFESMQISYGIEYIWGSSSRNIQHGVQT